MPEVSLLSAQERRLAPSWLRKRESHALPALLDRLQGQGARFLSVGELLAIRRGVQEGFDGIDVALAVQGDGRYVLAAVSAILDRGLPCMVLVASAPDVKTPFPFLREQELRTLRELRVPVQCAGIADWETQRHAPEHVFGALIRLRRHVERSMGAAPMLYSLATRRPDPEYFDLLSRAGFELNTGESGSGAQLMRRSLREHSRQAWAAG